jgi:nucleotide-binding universal stress UspA family protein
MTNHILLPTDSSLPALVATIKAVEMAKASDSTLVVLNVIEQMPSIEVEHLDKSRTLEHFRSSERDLDLNRNAQRRSIMRGHGLKPGRRGRHAISSPDLYTDLFRSADMEQRIQGRMKEFDEDE